MISYVLGVDPGLKGSCVLLHNGNPIHSIELSKCLTTMGKVNSEKTLNLISSKTLSASLKAMPFAPEAIVIEVPLSLPGLGLQSIATSHTNFGILLATVRLTFPEVKTELVVPSTWTSAIWGRFCKNSCHVNNKLKSKEAFNRLWPCSQSIKITEGSVDATLIAIFWCWKYSYLPKKT